MTPMLQQQQQLTDLLPRKTMMTRGDSLLKEKKRSNTNGHPENPGTTDALVCVGFAMSAAQAAYQRDSQREEPDSGIFFFKDATPKSEHFVEFRVQRGSTSSSSSQQPLTLELVSLPSGTTDYSRAEVFAEQEFLKPVTPSQRNQRDAAQAVTPPVPVVGAVLRYRVEVGSYRQGDRRFAIRARLASEPSVLPCFTPPIYVASKVKRPPGGGAHSHAHDKRHKVDDVLSEGSSTSPGTVLHADEAQRQRPEEVGDERPPPEMMVVDTRDELAAIHARLAALEDAVMSQVLPSLRRVEQRLSYDLSFSQMLNTTDDSASVKPPLLQASSSELVLDPYAGGYWADSFNSMGNGIQEGMDALLPTDALVPSTHPIPDGPHRVPPQRQEDSRDEQQRDLVSSAKTTSN